MRRVVWQSIIFCLGGLGRDDRQASAASNAQRLDMTGHVHILMQLGALEMSRVVLDV